MRWLVVVVVTLAGCRQWFGFDSPELVRDAADGDAAFDAKPIDASPDADTLAACPPSYNIISSRGPRYRHVTSSIDWINAQPDCANDASLGSGVHTHLAVLLDDTERADLNGLLQTTVWIGLSDRVVANQWKWVTLEATAYPPITVPPWAPNEPSGGHCGAMDENGRLESRECDGANDVPYVCECDFYPDTLSQHE